MGLLKVQTKVGLMENLATFWKRVQELYKHSTPFDERKPTQQDLADAIGLDRSELSNRLNGTKGAKLTEANVRAIVRALAEWEAIGTQAEVQELLDMVGCPDFTPAEWEAPPLD